VAFAADYQVVVDGDARHLGRRRRSNVILTLGNV
jgi:hypothetical protein